MNRTAPIVRTVDSVSIVPGGADTNACAHDRIHIISLLIGLTALVLLVVVAV